MFKINLNSLNVVNDAKFDINENYFKIIPKSVNTTNFSMYFTNFQPLKTYKVTLFVRNTNSNDLNIRFSANSDNSILVKDSIKLNKNEEWIKVELILSLPYNTKVLYLQIIDLSNKLYDYDIKKQILFEEICSEDLISLKSQFKNIENENVDFIVSLGSACKPAKHLRTYGLTYVSNPLDWMMGYSLETANYLINTDFKDFFKEISNLNNDSGNHYRILDTKNNVISIHHFDKNQNLIEEQKQFNFKMIKRGLRMKEYILRSDSLLFISDRVEPRENFYKFMESFYNNYNKKITYVNIRNSDEPDFSIFINQINKDLKFIEYSFNDIHPNGYLGSEDYEWLGNEKYWGLILNSINLSNKLQNFNFNEKEHTKKIESMVK